MFEVLQFDGMSIHRWRRIKGKRVEVGEGKLLTAAVRNAKAQGNDRDRHITQHHLKT